MDCFSAGGSFTEYYALDLEDDIVLMGHDGPGHIAIAQGKISIGSHLGHGNCVTVETIDGIRVRPLELYHGKVGRGLSVEMSVCCCPSLKTASMDSGCWLRKELPRQDLCSPLETPIADIALPLGRDSLWKAGTSGDRHIIAPWAWGISPRTSASSRACSRFPLRESAELPPHNHRRYPIRSNFEMKHLCPSVQSVTMALPNQIALQSRGQGDRCSPALTIQFVIRSDRTARVRHGGIEMMKPAKMWLNPNRPESRCRRADTGDDSEQIVIRAGAPRVAVRASRFRHLCPGAQPKIEHVIPGFQIAEVQVREPGVFQRPAQVEAEVVARGSHWRH